MKDGRWIRAACELTLRVASLAVAAVLIAMVWPTGAPDADESAQGSQWTVVVGPWCDTTKVKMNVRGGRPFAHYSLEDEGGEEIVRVTYVRSGEVLVNMGDGYPVRPGVSTKTDGACEIAVKQDGVDYRLKIQPGGASGFSVTDNLHRVREGLGITREGELVHDPSIAD